MSRYISNILFLLLLPVALYAQVDSVKVIGADTIKVQQSQMTDDSVGVVHVDSVLVINRAPADAPRDTLKLKMPVYQGTFISLDIFNPIATAWRQGRFEFVVSADVSLWHRLIPVLEYGMMFQNHDYTSFRYTTNGLFVRAGAMYNFVNAKPDRKYDHMFGVGVRYGYSNVSYTLSDAQISDAYWNDQALVTSSKQNANVGWVEFEATVRVQVYKDFFMGINAKVKTFAHFYEQHSTYPTYIPGFGQCSDSAVNFGFEYLLTYRIPSKKLKEFRAANGF